MPRRPDRHDVMPPPRLPAVAAPPPPGPQAPRPACLPLPRWLLCGQDRARRHPSPDKPPHKQRHARAQPPPKSPCPSACPPWAFCPAPQPPPLPLLDARPCWGFFGLPVRVRWVVVPVSPSACRQQRVPGACAWCVVWSCRYRQQRVPGACAWCVCLVRVPGAWCGVVLSLHALQGVD